MKKINISLKTKLILTLTGVLVMTILGFWMTNQLFLPGYYQYSKVANLSNSYDEINAIVNNDALIQEGFIDGLAEHSQLAMETLAANSSMNVYVFQVNEFFGSLFYNFYYPSPEALSERQLRNIKEMTRDYVAERSLNQKIENGKELIRRKENYQVYMVYDKRIGSNYLELFGQLDSGKFVYIRTNYQSMRENVQISNRFFCYVGVLAILLGGIVLLVVGNSFTKPILHMTNIAKRMSQLDFEAKYPVTTKDEIGMLGTSINTLSERLEMTISELKTANNELQRDIEQKTQIDEMRKDFLANVSHELKTPIALIQGYAEGLQDNINDDKESQEFYCEVIIDEAKKMNKIVKKLLTLNQIEFGNNQVTFDHFDVVQVLRSVIQSASLLAEQKDAKIYMDEYAPIYVWADEYMVEEVITNYVSNAIHHVSGEKNIIVSLREKGDVVRVSVFNTGESIPESEMEKIWIKFYKVDKARTREYGGSGIGLSIVKAIMESMNQECGVCNREDGVEFWFELDRKS